MRIRHGTRSLQSLGAHDAGPQDNHGSHEPCRPDQEPRDDSYQADTEAVPIRDSVVPLLEILDVLRDLKQLTDAGIGRALETQAKRLMDLAPAEQKKLQRLAVDYYNAGTQALLGMLLTRNRQNISPTLRSSINPTTRFNFEIDSGEWPEGRAWNIR